jgi:hypothetical protein
VVASKAKKSADTLAINMTFAMLPKDGHQYAAVAAVPRDAEQPTVGASGVGVLGILLFADWVV